MSYCAGPFNHIVTVIYVIAMLSCYLCKRSYSFACFLLRKLWILFCELWEGPYLGQAVVYWIFGVAYENPDPGISLHKCLLLIAALQFVSIQ